MANDVSATIGSPPLVVYQFTVSAITSYDGTTNNAIASPSVPENFTCTGIRVFCKGTQAAYASAGTPTTVASTGTVDRHVTFNLYVKSTAGNSTGIVVVVELY